MNTDLLAEAFEACLRELGFEDVLQITRDARAPMGTRDSDVLFFLQLSVPEQVGAASRSFHMVRGRKVIVNFHPTAPDNRYGKWAADSFTKIQDTIESGRADCILEYNPHTAKWMREEGLPAIFCPIGYHELFDNTAMPRTGDGRKTHFIGRARGSRRGIVKSCGRGAVVHVNLWGLARRQYTRLRGVHLSLASYQPFRTCLTLRLIVLLASNRCAIVHQETDWCPLKHGVHCLIGEPEKISDYVLRLHEDPEYARRLSAEAHLFMTLEYRYKDHIEAALKKAKIL